MSDISKHAFDAKGALFAGSIILVLISNICILIISAIHDALASFVTMLPKTQHSETYLKLDPLDEVYIR